MLALYFSTGANFKNSKSFNDNINFCWTSQPFQYSDQRMVKLQLNLNKLQTEKSPVSMSPLLFD